MKILLLLLVLLFSFVLLCFLYLNQNPVTVKLLPGNGYQTPPVPLFAVIMVSLIGGVVMSGILAMGEQLRLRLRARQLERRVAGLERENNSLSKRLHPVINDENEESNRSVIPAGENAGDMEPVLENDRILESAPGVTISPDDTKPASLSEPGSPSENGH